MPYEPFETVRIGRTDVEVTRLGFGSAPIGGLFREIDDDEAARTVERAWALGIRYFDVAPLYGYGTAERRLGAVLRDRPRDDYVVSTKVGRLVRPADRIPPGADIDRQALDGRPDAFYAGTGGRRIVFDYSADGVVRSIEESLERLGLDRIDMAFIHDPDDHWQAAIEGAYPALHRLREQGVVRAIGAGMNQAAMLARFARETEMDVFLVAGRYTLLDQDGPTGAPAAVPRAGYPRRGRRRDEQWRPGRPGPGRPLRLQACRARCHRPRPSTGGGVRTPRCAAPGGRGPVPAGPPRRRRPRRGRAAGRAPRRVPGAHAPRAPARAVGRPARRKA